LTGKEKELKELAGSLQEKAGEGDVLYMKFGVMDVRKVAKCAYRKTMAGSVSPFPAFIQKFRFTQRDFCRGLGWSNFQSLP
jgi:hypothetical protein